MKLPSSAIVCTLLTTGVLSLLAPPAANAGMVRTTPVQRAKAATVAAGRVGAPYRWGAAGPRAFDCSGLVSFAYRSAGAPLAARTAQGMWRIGARVSRAGLRRGDLVWTWDRARGHVGLYLGAGRYVHAPAPGRRVTVAALPAGPGFVGARRP